jgi:hypothetical protein
MLRAATNPADVDQLVDRMLACVEADETTSSATAVVAACRLAALVLAEVEKGAILAPLCGVLVEDMRAELLGERAIGVPAGRH